MHERWLVVACVVGVGFFVVTYGVAMALYPGGTWFDARTQGHSFWANFLCDLMQTRALNKQPAPLSSTLARLGTYGMILGLAAFYTLLARLESSLTKAGRVSIGAGLSAVLIVCTVPFVPSNLARNAHVTAVIAAFFPGMIATMAGLIICMRVAGVSWLIRIAALTTLIAGACNGFFYIYVYAQHYGFVPVVRSPWLRHSLPIFQRIATLALLVWIAAICLRTISARRASSA